MNLQSWKSPFKDPLRLTHLDWTARRNDFEAPPRCQTNIYLGCTINAIN